LPDFGIWLQKDSGNFEQQVNSLSQEKNVLMQKLEEKTQFAELNHF
jgi:hypothetical protein